MNKLRINFLLFRKSLTAISFQYTQHNFVPEMNQSGTTDRQLSTVMRLMDTRVYRTKNLQSC